MKLPPAFAGATLLATLAMAPAAYGDQEAGNSPRVTASQYGNCYAKSVPSARYGVEGRTYIYFVEPEDDRLVQSYDWFGPQLRLECNVSGANDGPVGVSVAQFGPWARGDTANAETLAIAFYWNDQLLHSYSTLDIAGSADNVSASESHYTVIDDIIGYAWRDGNNYTFSIRTIDGRTIAFDAGSGAILSVTTNR